MPELIWPDKKKFEPVSASLEVDSIVYPGGTGYPTAKVENQLILGDNRLVMAALLPEYEGRINLIYADPPFFTNRRFQTRVGRGEDSRKPRDWRLVEGYPDSWPNIDAYLDMLYPRLELMYQLLAPGGTLYLHLDWHADGYARLLLDEIFGPENLLNEIIWVYHGPSPIRRAFNRKHDTILVYTKGQEYTFNVDAVRQPYDPNTVKTFASSSKAGFGKVPNLERGKVPEDWWYFPVVARLHRERTGYPTQKPEALLERVISASSNPGDLVADFFCGSGTLPLVASRLGRRFIASDVTWRAVHTTQIRLVEGSPLPYTLAHLEGHPRSFERFPGKVSIHQSDLSIDLAETVPELDYWEVDPAWDGSVFRSVLQASRPRAKASLARSVALPAQMPRERLCIRMVDVDGRIYQSEIAL
jgi:site-specific DNA-methyltransferase (adenine-specific)